MYQLQNLPWLPKVFMVNSQLLGMALVALLLDSLHSVANSRAIRPMGSYLSAPADHCPAEMWGNASHTFQFFKKPEILSYVKVPSVWKHCEDAP